MTVSCACAVCLSMFQCETLIFMCFGCVFSETEMNNPYRQFNIQPRPNTRLQAVQPDGTDGGLNSSNFHAPTLGTVRLLSPTVAGDNQRLYNALYSSAPVMPINGTTDYSAFGQAALNPLVGVPYPGYMTNCNSGMPMMPVMPIVPLNMGNHPFMPHQPTNFPDAAGMCSNVQANNLLMQFMPGSAPVMQNHMAALQPQAASAQQVYNTPMFPGVSFVPNSFNDAANVLSGDVNTANIPFRQVQWSRPAVHETGVPQIPYAVEIKPDNDETPENNGPFSNTATINGMSAAVEYANEPSAPLVYVDVAMDNSTRYAKKTNKRTVATLLADNDVVIVKEKAGRQKGRQSEIESRVKVLKLLDKYSVKPCVVSLARIDSSSIDRYRADDRHKSNDGVEEFSVAERQELNESVVDASVFAEVQELWNNDDDHAIPETQDASLETAQEYADSQEIIPETRDASLETAQEFADCQDMIPETQDASLETAQEFADCQDMIPETQDASLETAQEFADGQVIISETQDASLETTQELADSPDMPVSVQELTNSPITVTQDAANTVPEEEAQNSEDVTLPTTQTTTNDNASDQLIGSDEDVGEGNPYDDNDCMLIEDASLEKSTRYEVMPTSSDALLFDMECDGEKTSETLRVLLPTKKSVTVGKKAQSTKKTAPLLRKMIQAKMQTSPSPSQVVVIQVCNVPSAGDSDVAPIDVDADDSDDVVFVASKTSTADSTSTHHNLRPLAASSCSEQVPAGRFGLDRIAIKRSENSLLGIPLQSSFFRLEAQSSEVFRLLSIQRSSVPRDVLALLCDLVASVDTAGDKCSNSCASSGSGDKVPFGGSRTLLFQCLFCPYGEMSAKRIMAHVRQQHREYASFIQRSLLPARNTMLHLYCRHCNFITYDNAAMFVHFAVYHKVPGILVPQPRDVEREADPVPAIDPEANAREFPFYCCPNCRYIDVEWRRITQHVLRKHFTESVFLGCVVRLLMVGHTSRYLSSYTYESLARQQKCKVARKEIYACIGCRFFSFYPSYAFSHYVRRHSSLEMLFVCAAVPSCSKRFSTVEDVISHIQSAHVVLVKNLLFQCTVTLFDTRTSTELNISPGKLIAADVPVQMKHQSSSASVTTSLDTAIEIIDDDDDSGDVVVLRSTHEVSEYDDVEPDSASEECDDENDVHGSSEVSSESAVEKQAVVEKSEPSCSSQKPAVGERMAEDCREEREEMEVDVAHGVEDRTSGINASDVTNSSCSDGDQNVTEPVHQNCETDADRNVEDDTSEMVVCDSPHEMSEQELGGNESQSVKNSVRVDTSGTSLHELVDSVVDSEFGVSDATNPTGDSAALVADSVDHTHLLPDDESFSESQSAQNPVTQMSQTESLDSAEHPTLSSNDTNWPIDSATVVADVVNEAPVSTNDESAAGLTVHVTDDASLPEEDDDCTINEAIVTNPQLNDVCTAEHELSSSDQPKNVELHNEHLEFNDDTLSSFELRKSPSSEFVSGEGSVLDLREELSLLEKELTADELQPSEGDSNVVQTVSCSAVSAVESITDDESRIVSAENPCLASCQNMSDDSFCNDVVETGQLRLSESDGSWPQEADAVGDPVEEDSVENSVPSYAECSSEMPVESRDLEVSDRTDSTTEQCNVVYSTDKPVVNPLRFKSLAGFRFSAPSSFTAKPSRLEY